MNLRRAPLYAVASSVFLFAACTDTPSPSEPSARDLSTSAERSQVAQDRLAALFPDVSSEVMAMPGTVYADNDEVRGKLVFGVENQNAVDGVTRSLIARGLSADEFVVLVGRQPSEVPSIDALRDEEDASAPDKRRTLETLLARGPVLVHVDARRAEVNVPPRFRADASLVLRFGYSLSPAIADLSVDDNAIAGTLTFGGQPFHCVLPWTAVYAAMVEGEQRGTVWPEDVPEDVLTGTAEPPAAVPATHAPETAPAAAPSPTPRAKRASHLKLVD